MKFLSDVSSEFDLGQIAVVLPIPGGNNRLWRIDTAGGGFVVKEFPFKTANEHGLLEASQFEAAVLATGLVIAPEPMRNTEGEFISFLEGSRRGRVAVRVHRWLEGKEVTDFDSDFAEAAGKSLADIQASGRSWSTRANGSLEWWEIPPLLVLDRLLQVGLFSEPEAADGSRVLEDAHELIREGERANTMWVYSHSDHKPENCLRVGRSVAVLDWDECGHIPPKMEAVEAALRWSGVYGGGVNEALFGSFLGGYVSGGGDGGALVPSDFAKLVAASAGWFSKMGRRALGDFDDNATERADSERMAHDTMLGLRRSLNAIPGWCRLL